MSSRPNPKKFANAKTLTDLIKGMYEDWQGYDPINIRIDSSLEGQGIGGYNIPDQRLVVLNSDDPNKLLFGFVENWKIALIESLEMVTRHTENDWASSDAELKCGKASGRTYIVSEIGQRKKYFKRRALTQCFPTRSEGTVKKFVCHKCRNIFSAAEAELCPECQHPLAYPCIRCT